MTPGMVGGMTNTTDTTDAAVPAEVITAALRRMLGRNEWTPRYTADVIAALHSAGVGLAVTNVTAMAREIIATTYMPALGDNPGAAYRLAGEVMEKLTAAGVELTSRQTNDPA